MSGGSGSVHVCVALGWTEIPEFCFFCAGPLWACDSTVDAAGLRWVWDGLLVAIVWRQHFLCSSVQLQSCDRGDVSRELWFPPHQRAFSALVFLDLNTQTEGSATSELMHTTAPIHATKLVYSGLSEELNKILIPAIWLHSYLLFETAWYKVIYAITVYFNSFSNYLTQEITCEAKQLTSKTSSFVMLKKQFFYQQAAIHCVPLLRTHASVKMLFVCTSPTPTWYTQREQAHSLEVLCGSAESILLFSIWQILANKLMARRAALIRLGTSSFVWLILKALVVATVVQ